MKNTTTLMLLACLFGLGLTGGVAAAAEVSGRVVLQGEHGVLDIAFSDRDRDMIREYYGYTPKQKHLPPGLAKKGKLPPGIQKQLIRQGRLPSDLLYDRFPQRLERQLSPIPDGYARIIVGTSFVLLNQQTRVIFDIIEDFY